MSNIIVIGIAGGSGSGKTTLMKNLIARFIHMIAHQIDLFFSLF